MTYSVRLKYYLCFFFSICHITPYKPDGFCLIFQVHYTSSFNQNSYAHFPFSRWLVIDRSHLSNSSSCCFVNVSRKSTLAPGPPIGASLQCNLSQLYTLPMNNATPVRLSKKVSY